VADRECPSATTLGTHLDTSYEVRRCRVIENTKSGRVLVRTIVRTALVGQVVELGIAVAVGVERGHVVVPASGHAVPCVVMRGAVGRDRGRDVKRRTSVKLVHVEGGQDVCGRWRDSR